MGPLTFTRFTLDAHRRVCADGEPIIGVELPYPTRRSLALALFTSPEPGAGDFEWIDIGDKLACTIIRYRGPLEIDEVRSRAEEVLPAWCALEVTRDVDVPFTFNGVPSPGRV